MGDRVLIAHGTRTDYEASSPEVFRLVQVVGCLNFSCECDIELNVGLLTYSAAEMAHEQVSSHLRNTVRNTDSDRTE